MRIESLGKAREEGDIVEKHDPRPALHVGARVKVHRDPEYGDGPWPNEPIGTAVEHPLAP